MRSVGIGDARLFALTDCAPAPAACSYSFPDADLAEHPEAARWFPAAQFRTRFGPFLLRRPAGDVLIDCGMGPGGVSYFPELAGNLDDELERAGSSLERIANVVFTHLHVDHVGWAPRLINAQFHVAAAEWEHWSQPNAGLPHHVDAIARCIAPLGDRLHMVEPGREILPGVALLAAYGHSPGHCAVLVEDRALIAGDSWHNPAQIEVPSWCHRADMDKPTAVASRRRLAALAAQRDWLVAAGHFSEDLAFGHIVPSGDGFAYAVIADATADRHAAAPDSPGPQN